LAEALTQNTTLELLGCDFPSRISTPPCFNCVFFVSLLYYLLLLAVGRLGHNWIMTEGAASIAEALKKNKTITSLE
jgi:hypothetical protein